MRDIFIALFSFSSVAQAEISPIQWLENCLSAEIPQMNRLEMEEFSSTADSNCLSSYLYICEAVDERDICIDKGSEFIDASFDQEVLNFPDFSHLENSFLVRIYSNLVKESSTDELRAIQDCQKTANVCDYYARSIRLMGIRGSRRRVIEGPFVLPAVE